MREEAKKKAKQSRRRREETQPNNNNNDNNNNSKLSALVALVARLPFSNSFPRFSLTSYLSVVVLHLSFGPCMRVQGELNQLTLGANKLTCKHFTATAVASLSLPPLPLSPYSLQSFPTRFLLLKCNLAMPQIFLSLVFQVCRCVCVGVRGCACSVCVYVFVCGN